MRYALTALACALVAGLAALMVGETSPVPDPPPVQLVDDARTAHSAGEPVRARRERDRGDRARRARGAVDDEVSGDRASAATSSPPSSAPPATVPSSPPPVGDDDEGEDD